MSQLNDSRVLSDGGWLAGAGVMLGALVFAARAIPGLIAQFRKDAAGGGDSAMMARDEGRWQGSTSAILERLARCMEELTSAHHQMNTGITTANETLRDIKVLIVANEAHADARTAAAVHQVLHREVA